MGVFMTGMICEYLMLFERKLKEFEKGKKTE